MVTENWATRRILATLTPVILGSANQGGGQVFGQSAGAVSTALLMTVDDVHDLFRAALWESEPVGLPMRNPESWDLVIDEFLARSGCDEASGRSFPPRHGHSANLGVYRLGGVPAHA